LGMSRVHRSFFISDYRPSLLSEVKRAVNRIIDLGTDNVQLYFLTPTSYRMRIVLAQALLGEGGIWR